MMRRFALLVVVLAALCAACVALAAPAKTPMHRQVFAVDALNMSEQRVSFGRDDSAARANFLPDVAKVRSMFERFGGDGGEVMARLKEGRGYAGNLEGAALVTAAWGPLDTGIETFFWMGSGRLMPGYIIPMDDEFCSYAILQRGVGGNIIVLWWLPLRGPTGPQGTPGPPGAPGARGDTGGCGTDGATGAKGEKGDTGPAGPTGAAGPAGVQGPKGDTGPTGATGSAGPKGDRGEPGATGAIGATGHTGPAGPAGKPGGVQTQTVTQTGGGATATVNITMPPSPPAVPCKAPVPELVRPPEVPPCILPTTTTCEEPPPARVEHVFYYMSDPRTYIPIPLAGTANPGSTVFNGRPYWTVGGGFSYSGGTRINVSAAGGAGGSGYGAAAAAASSTSTAVTPTSGAAAHQGASGAAGGR